MNASRRLVALLLLPVNVLMAQDAPPPAPPPPPPPATDTTPPPPVIPSDVPTPTPPPPPPQPVDVVAPSTPTETATTVTTTAPAIVPTATGPGQVQEVTTSTPALEIKFPGGTGNATVQFPTEKTVATTAAQPEEVITVDFPNEEIRTILRNVADLFELNLVIPEALTGTTSVKLRNVTWKQVFQVVLEPAGYTYAIDGNIVKIKNRAEMATEPTETHVYLLNSARAQDLLNSLTPLIDAGAGDRMVVDNRTNALVVTTRPSHMNNIQEIIERLDRPTQQVSIESKFIELNLDDDKTLGLKWNFNDTTLASAGTAWQYNMYNGLNVLPKSGAMPPQQAPPGPAGLNAYMAPTDLANVIPARVARNADLAFFNQSQYTAVLKAIQTAGNGRLVSNPTVVTLDNEEIFIHVGQTIPVVYPQINNQTGTATPGEHVNIDVGTKLKVKPQVSNNNFINLTLNPEISRKGADITYFGGNYPIIETRKLTDAKVTLKDGYTLAIGGLIDDEDRKDVESVPILSSIPIIGNLFKSTRTVHNHHNLIIFVTAKILNPDGATYRDVISPDLMMRTGVTASDVPGYYDLRPPNAVPPAGVTYASAQEMNQLQDVLNARSQEEVTQKMQKLQKDLKDAQQSKTDYFRK